MFRAYDAGRERLVAVKLFKLDLPPERVHQLVAAFERLIAADLTHPAMAVPLGTGIADVSAYLAQDYVAAESLDLAVREYGPAPPVDALRVAAQLAGALDFAAVVNVAHGALHPRDILLSSDETRMTGIGVARALESVGVTAPVRRPYTAPERIAGRPWDRRADVFSLAALIHELFWARRITGTGDAIAETLTELPGADLRALRAVFARALAEDPQARFDTALEFVDALKTAFPGVTLEQSAVGSRQSKSAVALRRPQGDLRTADSGLRTAHVDREPLLPLDAAEPVIPETQPEPEPPPPNPTPPFDAHALDLGAAEAARFEQIETAPALAPAEEVTPMREEPIPMRDDPMPEDPPISLVEESRSAVWPLVAALLIGLALGFAGGYGVGTREHPAAPPAVASVPAAPPATGREGTDVAIAEKREPPAARQEQSGVAPRGPQGDLEQRRGAGSQQSPPSRQSQSAVSSGQPPKRASKTADSRQPTARPATPTARTATPPARTAPPASATTGGYQGGLTVDSRPTGARVYLDGRMIGNTPLVLPAVPAGEHAIRIERDGYQRWSSSVRIVAAEQSRVTASLER